jgi:hypothetical protein
MGGSAHARPLLLLDAVVQAQMIDFEGGLS